MPVLFVVWIKACQLVTRPRLIAPVEVIQSIAWGCIDEGCFGPFNLLGLRGVEHSEQPMAKAWHIYHDDYVT